MPAPSKPGAQRPVCTRSPLQTRLISCAVKECLTNSHRFVDRLDRPAFRIPLLPPVEGLIRVARHYVLVAPTTAAGNEPGWCRSR